VKTRKAKEALELASYELERAAMFIREKATGPEAVEMALRFGESSREAKEAAEEIGT